MPTTLFYQWCGKNVTISEKYAGRIKKAECLECGTNLSSVIEGNKFDEVLKAGWYADHLKDLEQKAFKREYELWKIDLGLDKKPRGFKFKTMHGWAIATVLALMAASYFSGTGSDYYGYWLLFGAGAAATIFTYESRND